MFSKLQHYWENRSEVSSWKEGEFLLQSKQSTERGTCSYDKIDLMDNILLQDCAGLQLENNRQIGLAHLDCWLPTAVCCLRQQTSAQVRAKEGAFLLQYRYFLNVKKFQKSFVSVLCPVGRVPELCSSADCLWQEGFYLWYQCLFTSVFQSTGLFCLFFSDGEGWIHALGKDSHLAGYHGCTKCVLNVADWNYVGFLLWAALG